MSYIAERNYNDAMNKAETPRTRSWCECHTELVVCLSLNSWGNLAPYFKCPNCGYDERNDK